MSLNTESYINRMSFFIAAAQAIKDGKQVQFVSPEGAVLCDNVDMDYLIRNTIPYTQNSFIILDLPAPTLPFGMFYIRKADNPENPARLVGWIDEVGKVVGAARPAGLGPSSNSPTTIISFNRLFREYHWSFTRKDWFTFTNHQTPIK